MKKKKGEIFGVKNTKQKKGGGFFLLERGDTPIPPPDIYSK